MLIYQRSSLGKNTDGKILELVHNSMKRTSGWIARITDGWSLCCLISLVLCALMSYRTLSSDFSQGEHVSALVGFSVRWAVPFIYIVVAASAVRTLFPGRFSDWWLRNRKQFGFCFAVAMAWQAVFIYIMSNSYRDYYYDEIYLLRDELEGSLGYIFLVAMVITTFSHGKKLINHQQWKLLHTSGIYFLWAYPFSVYWWVLSYYEEARLLDYLYYWAGFLAFSLRIAAWGKRRQQQSVKSSATLPKPTFFMRAGYFLIIAGIVIAATGQYWQKSVTSFLTAPHLSEQLVLWLPFWPFEPFYSLIIIGIGAFMATFQARDESHLMAKGISNE